MVSEVSEVCSEVERSPTERVRAMLDERGVEYNTLLGPSPETVTYFDLPDGRDVGYTDFGDGHTQLRVWNATPEQAIAATVGRLKVKKVRGTTYDERGGEVYYLACSGCGEWIDGDLDCITEFDGPNFCPNCGGEFDGPLLCKRCGGLADLEYGDMCVECYEEEAE